MALRGVSGEQDGRFADKDARERRRVRLPAEVEAGGPVDLRRVNLGALRPWVAAQLRERLGFEDDIVEGFVLGQLEGASADPRAVTVSLKPFLGDEHAAPFVVELWRLLLSAQESPGGIPRQFVEEEAARAREARKEAERLEQEMARARRRFEEGSRERAAAFRPGPGEGRRPSRWEQPQGVGRGRHQTVPAWMEEPGDPGEGRGALGEPPQRAFGGGQGRGEGRSRSRSRSPRRPRSQSPRRSRSRSRSPRRRQSRSPRRSRSRSPRRRRFRSPSERLRRGRAGSYSLTPPRERRRREQRGSPGEEGERRRRQHHRHSRRRHRDREEDHDGRR